MMELGDIGGIMSSSSDRERLSSFRSASSDARSHDDNNDELELQWAAIERLPTMRRLRTSLFDHKYGKDDKDPEAAPAKINKMVIDVTELGAPQRHLFIGKLIKQIEEDNLRLQQKLKQRIARVGLESPKVQVRYQNLRVEAECNVVQGRPIPTIWNTVQSIFPAFREITCWKREPYKLTVLKGVSGIIKPSRITLLLGPPSCGKTTLLQALAGRHHSSLKVTGDISYNGYQFNEFVPQKTSAYISQYDLHIAEMTVRETLDFSARCQGIGDRADTMKELLRREKQAGIIPDPDIDTYMKAISVEGLRSTLLTDYIIRIIGLDICADTIVGDAMNRGISGGQKRRLTTGEMIVGPTRVLFMDEISTGLDSSTTFQIISCLQQLAHMADFTILVSLLQPAPETFDLFDDVILMAEGTIVYHGPRKDILDCFEHCGFRCPARKGVADFLQEVVSRKDQGKYWHHENQAHTYVSVGTLAEKFNEFHLGRKLDQELSSPFPKSDYQESGLSPKDIYSIGKWELLKACMEREWLLMKRNAFVHVFKSAQLVVIAVITMTVFLGNRKKLDLVHANYFLGSLFYALIRLMCNGIAELALTVSRLTVFYKQRNFYLYPAWAYSIPAIILKVPFSFLDAILWTGITYYVIGYSPEPERFFYQFLLLFLLHQVSVSMFRLIASVVRNPPIASTCSILSLMLIFLFGGFVIPKPFLPAWLRWAFWLSPMAYAEISVSVNEFLAPRWQKVSSSNVTLGHQILINRGLNFDQYYYWISVAALLGFWVVFNIGFTCALHYLDAPGRSRTKVSYDQLRNQDEEDLRNITAKETSPSVNALKDKGESNGRRNILPFEQIAISFEDVQYFVDTPKKLREQGYPHKRLQLLQDITGSFRPGVLTALMGVSGAGKTTLMDVLSGRKTGGMIEGDIRIGGYPKVQKAYAKISGYCEQSDIHSPQITVEESVRYSAWLRLPAQVDKNIKEEFADEVIHMIELEKFKDCLVGIPGVNGISTEQRKRLTIAVELVANPSILFMDEPTSGLDARAAAIVMRVVKNIVNTKRTVVCTIHQPSIDIFESFDELILMKRGGQIIYSGELGQNSSKLIEYFESIPGVPKIKENYNPATWMLEATTPSAEAQLGLDFAQVYKESTLCRETKRIVEELNSPRVDSETKFSTLLPKSGWEQFKACLWKQHLSYWRSPKYNLTRLLFTTASSVLFGVLLWQKGQKIESQQDFFNIVGATFIFMQLTGISNCSAVMPFIARERAVMYRERFAGMYSSWSYTLSQVIIELPYMIVQAVLFTMITYPAVNFYWSFYKICWYFYCIFSMLLYFNYFGMLLASLTPSYQVASVMASLSYTLLNLFAGFVIPQPRIPTYWVWAYWTCPLAWGINGLVTSQYGDIKQEIMFYGKKRAINAFLKDYFGYNHDSLGIVAVVLLAFPLLSAIGFIFAIAKLNFQRR